jgi:hypothetical protein
MSNRIPKVDDGLDQTEAMCKAMADIRDQRLWRVSHKSFEDYARDKFAPEDMALLAAWEEYHNPKSAKPEPLRRLHFLEAVITSGLAHEKRAKAQRKAMRGLPKSKRQLN